MNFDVQFTTILINFLHQSVKLYGVDFQVTKILNVDFPSQGCLYPKQPLLPASSLTIELFSPLMDVSGQSSERGVHIYNQHEIK
jgi:hypothetical protein